MQTKSRIARIAAALAIAVVLPLAILITTIHSGNQPLAHPALSSAASVANLPAQVTPEQARMITEKFGRLPMSFEPNLGQKNSGVKFYSHGSGYELFLANQEAVMSVHNSAPMPKGASFRTMRPDQRAAALRSQKASIVRLKLDGSNPDAQLAGEAPLPGKVSYFIGNDPSKWHTDIPTFASVKYSAVYPGVDVLYYGNQTQLEYDFVVAPGADPKQIAFNIDGAKTIHVDKRGNLVLNTAAGNVTLKKPFVYQQDAGQRREIAGNYVVSTNHEVRFALGGYDPSKPLTIDPVLIYSTYLGGTGNGDFANSIALDGQGDAWVAGYTFSTDLPPTNSLIPAPSETAGFGSAFVAEVNPTGTGFLYLSYLGGSGNGSFGDEAYGVAVDGNGNVYVTGVTTSADFPLSANAFLATPPATTAQLGAAFVTALHPATAGSTQLVYSTFFGGNGVNALAGSGQDIGFSIATDGNGNAYFAGVTTSSDIHFVNPIVATANSAVGNAYVAEINTAPASGAMVFGSYLGGSGTGSTGGNLPFGDTAQAITLDSAGHTYVAGSTSSTDFAPSAASGSTPCGDAGNATAFLVEIDTTVAAPTSLFSYCYGGAQGDTLALGTTIAPDKTAVVAGKTYASDFGVTSGSIPAPSGVPNVGASLGFVTKFNTTGSPAVPYSTVLGGTSSDTFYSVATDAAGDLYLGGFSQSADFPVTQGALVVTNINPNGTGTVTKINPAGGGASDLIYASYFGGAGQNAGFGDSVNGIAVSSAHNAYIAGATSSASTGATPFPILPNPGAAQTALSNVISNAFIAELPLTPTITIAPLTLSFGTQPLHVPTTAQYVTVTNNTAAGVSLASSITGTNAADFSISSTGTTPCTGTIASGTTCTIGVVFTASVTAPETATLKVIDGDDGPTHPWLISLSGSGGTVPAVGLNPTSLTFAGTLIGATSAAQTVTVTNTGSAPLIFGATAITPSVANFSVGSDTCSGTSVAAAGTCTFAVTLAPPTGAVAGPTSGTIQIANNASNSPQSVAVSGTVWDFSLTVPASASVNRGTNSSFSVLINGLGGFAGTVGVGCSSAASSIATCSVSPSSGTPTQTVTVTLTGVSTVMPLDSPNGMPPFSVRQIVFAAIALMLLFVIPMTRRTRTRLGLAAAMLVFAVVAGCSGSTKTKTTTLTITGTAGTVSKTYTTSVSVGG